MERSTLTISGRPVPEDTEAEPEPVAVSPPKKKKKGTLLKLKEPLKKKRPEPEDPIAALFQGAGADDAATKPNGKKATNGKKPAKKKVEVAVEEADDDDEESNGVIIVDDEEARKAAAEAWKKEDEDVRAWEVVCICAYISGLFGALGIFFGFYSSRYLITGAFAAAGYFAVGTLAGLLLLQFCQWCDASIRERSLACVYGCIRRMRYIGSAFTWILKK